MITLYNTLTEKKERLPVKKGLTKMFVCGPTVYDRAHIGHARTYIVFDTLVRHLRSAGIDVKYVQNITDIDDKIIERAGKENKKPRQIARFFEKEYLLDMKKLNVTAVSRYARASDYIEEIKKQIAALIKRGFAYRTDTGVYFEVKKFPRYGRLSKQNLEELRPGWRIEPDPQKRDPLDFALWKFSKERKNQNWHFSSPWGAGRPGWHIEDTAISEKLLGPQYEIHGAAVDLKFPHHESEIAQQESASGKKPFVKMWMHTGFLLVGGEKMSKSLGSFITIKDFLKRYPADVLRLAVLSHHYRSPINYTEETAAGNRSALEKIEKFMSTIGSSQKNDPPSLKILIKKTEAGYQKALADDFNTPQALGEIFSFIAAAPKTIGAKKWTAKKLSLLGFKIKFAITPKKITGLLEQRERLRKNKKFAAADKIRAKIEKLGFLVEDPPAGGGKDIINLW